MTRRNIGNDADNLGIFVPQMLDYEKVVKSGLERLKNNNYDSWSMLIKLCFEDPSNKNNNKKLKGK